MKHNQLYSFELEHQSFCLKITHDLYITCCNYIAGLTPCL